MTTKDDPELFALIVSEYTPYDGFEEFHEGFLDFEHGLHHNPYDASRGKISKRKPGLVAKRLPGGTFKRSEGHNASRMAAKFSTAAPLRHRPIRHRKKHRTRFHDRRISPSILPLPIENM
jgi:hypothetical protein